MEGTLTYWATTDGAGACDAVGIVLPAPFSACRIRQLHCNQWSFDMRLLHTAIWRRRDPETVIGALAILESRVLVQSSPLPEGWARQKQRPSTARPNGAPDGTTDDGAPRGLGRTTGVAQPDRSGWVVRTLQTRSMLAPNVRPNRLPAVGQNRSGQGRQGSRQPWRRERR
jgi:hypothetical protein